MYAEIRTRVVTSVCRQFR